MVGDTYNVGSTIEQSIDNSIFVKVDERYELVCVAFRLAEAEEYSRCLVPDYSLEVDTWFSGFKGHPVVDYIKCVREKYNLGYSIVAKMATMIQIEKDGVSIDRKCISVKNFTGEYRSCWTRRIFRKLVRLLDDFYRDSEFHTFYENHLAYYRSIVKSSADVLSKVSLDIIEQTFCSDQYPVDIYLGLLSGPSNYSIPGVEIRKHWNKHIAIVVGVGMYDVFDQSPHISEIQLDIIIHEICHFFTRSVVDKLYGSISRSMTTIYDNIRDKMIAQGYGNPRSMTGEWINELFTTFYLVSIESDNEIQSHIVSNEERGFIFFGETFALMKKVAMDDSNWIDKEFIPAIISYSESLPQRWPELQESFIERHPRVISTKPGNNSVIIRKKSEVIIEFSEPMKTGISGTSKLEDYDFLPIDFSSCHWEGEKMFVFEVNGDLMDSGNQYAFRLPLACFVSRQSYHLSNDVDIVFTAK